MNYVVEFRVLMALKSYKFTDYVQKTTLLLLFFNKKHYLCRQNGKAIKSK